MSLNRTSNCRRTLAAFLEHPACIGEPREWILQRFEELVFHRGERVFMPLSESKTVEQPPRRLNTIHDAAAWIQKNWPDFDLEATHPVTIRETPRFEPPLGTGAGFF